MLKNEISQRKKVIFFMLLIILNIILRIPSIPHEIGNDSYQIHALANSISESGTARWWVNSLSAFGLYSYSYASAVPFFLSGISQLSNLDMEKVILLYCMILGVFSIFTAYLMAGALYDNVLFKYIFAFFFSTSQGILQFTSFDASTRGMFMVMFPLIFYFLLKEDRLWRKSTFIIIFLVYLRSVHNFSYFALPLIFTMIIIYLGLKIKTITKKEIKITINSEKLDLLKKVNFIHIYIFLLLFTILAPFFMKLFVVGSRYQYLIVIFITTARYVGPAIFFALGGLIYSIYKKEKGSDNWFILISTLFFIPISYSSTYGKFIIIPFVIFFIAIAFKNSLFIISSKKLNTLFIISIVMSSILFSSYYNHYRTGDSQQNWYMDEKTNQSGIWARSYIPQNSHVFTTIGSIWRMLAISNGHIEFPSLPPLELVYGFVNEAEVLNNTLGNSYTSLDYYFEGPYYQQGGTSKLGEYEWVMNFDIKDRRIQNFIEKYDIKYVVYDVRSRRGKIIGSVEENNDLIYDGDRIKIWSV
ncbi:hypothetical protein EO98_04570 [Methanosarcina sp. 2.H.T.1A.6]|uniref:hypothetical protein n=1 Tax=unclassified Methanosarcina TaxID=2644672 RepID=UPI000622716B|nr:MULTISPECIES: hypothetical protein [unclassified Methanosarcina]KKG15982.1 hypothetical protein EO94_05020 [Methanosarcina sp. 2.H.T.1A.3]KKG20396.1 hypothetical protein EO97_02980 [Methanosarcina sp. 2.H.T.1A.15]KKG21004.1 hypothetical protein EO96_06945 [Methanosarcina sp. 2.H.T.1A.8]KKG21261.1 hypothetical protein EO98_04570 [Methanosarcina sp. 2.H.T.1A.6]